MKQFIAVALLFLSATGSVRAESDCQRYLQLAQDEIVQYDDENAAGYLRQATTTCPSYDSYQQLGEVLSRLPERKDRKQAVDAFVSAHELAPTDQARARTLFAYAQVLKKDGDPFNALPLARQAQALDPGNTEIIALNQELDRQVNNANKEDFTRGLRDSLLKPIPMSASMSATKSKRPSEAQEAGGAAYKGPSVQIPINFDTGSTRVDWQTERNVAVLASALADPSVEGRVFVFVGHADVRGDEWLNLELSKRAATAVYREVVRIEPSLEARIEVEGHGEYEPIDPRNDDAAYRTNRRLQVVLK